MAKFLNRKEILAAEDIQTEAVECPGWGGVVLVKGMTGAERDAFEASIVEKRGKDYEANLADIRAKLAAMSLVDESGVRLFNKADVQALSQKSAVELDRVFNVGRRLSGLSEEDIDELAKNSASAQNGASGSD